MTDEGFYPQDTLARPEEIRNTADGLRGISGQLLGHGAAVGAVLSEVALSFSEVVSTAVAAQIGTNLAALETAVEATEYGWAVGSAWADDVAAFKADRADLIAQWEAAQSTDFGVPPLTGAPQAAAPDMVEALTEDRRQDIETARAANLRDFIAEASRRWERFQDRVREKGRMFREGATAPNLSLLTGYLGWGGMTLWPEEATPPVRGAEDGAAAAETVVEGLDGDASPDAVAEALSTVAVIARRAAEGQELTPAELDYLEAFYATMGDRILDVPPYLQSANGLPDAANPPGYVPPVPFDDPAVVEALTVGAANGLLILSRPTARTDDDDHDGYERLPQWVKDAFNPTGPSSSGAFSDLAGMGDLLAHSTVVAGPGFSRKLATSVGWMIDYAESREHFQYPYRTQELRAQVANSASHLLEVVGRNDEVCYELLTGTNMPEEFSPAEYFTNIYGYNWAADDGAGAASLTDFIPVWGSSGDPVAEVRAEQAMFSLVQIVTSDAGFEELMDGVGNSGGVPPDMAVGQVNPAITRGFVAAMAPFMDQFAGPQVDGADPTGISDLPYETRVRFTTLIGTDPDSATALAALAYTYEQQEFSEYAASGNVEANGGNIGRIRGFVDAGLINAQLDLDGDRVAAEAAAARHRQLGIDLAQQVIGLVPAPGASALVNTVVAVFEAQPGDTPSPPEAASPSRSEAESRYATAAGVVTALIASGEVPASTLPSLGMGPMAANPNPPSLADQTQALVDAAATAGYDLTAMFERIESAYTDPDLVDERDD